VTLGCVTLGCVVLGLGCGPSVGLTGGAGSNDDAPPLTTSSSPVTSTSTTTVADASASAGSADEDSGPIDPSGFFIDCGAAPEGASTHCTGTPIDCSLIDQDCPEGEKCNPYSSFGEPVWDAARCVPTAPGAGVSESPCLVEANPWSGLDNCGPGLWCCSLGGTCAFPVGDEVPVCLGACDPILQDCAATRGVCDQGAQNFACLPHVGPRGLPGDGCTYPGSCEAGAACLDAVSVPGCTDSACCTPYCDLNQPNPDMSCTAETVCIGWFSPGMAPLGYEHVGVCTTP